MNRRLRFETLESRLALCPAIGACDFASAALDINGDDQVTPADVVYCVNYLNLEDPPVAGEQPPITAVLTLKIINDLNVNGPHPVPQAMVEWMYDPSPVQPVVGEQVLLTLRSLVVVGDDTTGTIAFSFDDALLSGVRLVSDAGQDAGQPDLCDGTYTFTPALDGFQAWELRGTLLAPVDSLLIGVKWGRC